MEQHSINQIIGEIVAIDEEINEFAAQGENVQYLITERDGLVKVLELALYKANQKAAVAGTVSH